MSTNPFARLIRLLPKTPLRVGTVTASAAGVVTVQEPGGSAVVVRGTGTVGQKVYFRDGVVESAAPDLPTEFVEE